MRNTVMTDLWTHPDIETWRSANLAGMKVEALDGEIGSVDDATYDVGSSYLVVDTGPWIFGKKVLLPAGVIKKVDINDKHVWVNRTKEEIQNAPEFNESTYMDDAYRMDIGNYYGEGGRGFRGLDR
jgi:hypothetical protein